MGKNKKIFKILTFIFTGIVLFQAALIAVKISRTRKSSSVQAVGRAAIVLDDWGYNRRNIKDLITFGKPITVAILPNLPFSESIAEEAQKNNIEIILHLPLEPHSLEKKPEKGTICVNMSRKEISERLNNALESVPYAEGVSNHMGSKATENRRLMMLLFRRFKNKKLYFLDSLVTVDSVCSQTAADSGVKFAQRSVFLDNISDMEYIKTQLRQLLTVAKRQKSAIGIGHDRALTIKAIKEMLPEFQREGVELRFVSDLVR